MPDVVYEAAHAKVNLALSVGPPGPDGMHPICSWMITVDLCDELTVSRLEDGAESRYEIRWHDEAIQRSEIDWSIESDLAMRAHRALEQHVGQSLPIHMQLTKRIPTGSGLGGGSSDAAAMLRAGNAHFELGLSLEELARLGATLGSDVPFLVHSGSAVVEGLGEIIGVHQSVPDLHLVLILPPCACPTGRVYALFDEHGAASLQSERVRQLVGRAATDPVNSESLFNDLAYAAMSAAPELREIGTTCSELAGRPAQVTGSGSTLFIVCVDHSHALSLAQAIQQQTNVPALAVRSWLPDSAGESRAGD